MSTVREIQRESGRDLHGMRRLSEATVAASAQARQASDLLAHLSKPPEAVVPASTQQQVFDSFEEMCRRRQVTLPTELRPLVYHLLGIELAANSHALAAKPEQVAPATVYNGALDHLPEAYPDFRDMPGIFLEAVVGYPSDPEGFLHRVQDTESRLEQAERFAEFRNTPGIFRRAALYYLSDPESFLRQVQETVARLERDERFADFRGTPFVFRRAAVGYPSDPEKFLLRVRKAVTRLKHDKRFSRFRYRPGVFLQAAINHPSDPESHLLKLLADDQQ